MSPCGYQYTGELTPDGIDPTVFEDIGKTFPECSSFFLVGAGDFCFDCWFIGNQGLPKAGEGIVKGGLVY